MKRLLAIPFLALSLLWPAAPAGAASSVTAGWWTSSPVPSPDVPSGGLAVQGGPDASSPVAFSAVSFVLAAGETATAVKLGVTANSGTTPNAQLMACPVTSTVKAAGGGAMSDAPKYDCGTNVKASPSGDGKTYTFDVTRIAATGALSIAIVPTQPTDRVVFDAPTTSALESSTAPASTGTDSSAVDSASSSAAPSFSEAPSSGGSFDVPAVPAPEVPGPASGSLTGTDTARGSTGGADQTAAPASTSSTSNDHTRFLVPLALGLALLAAVLWFSAGATHEPVAELANERS